MLKNLVNRFRETLSPVPVAKPTRLRVPTQSERIMQLVRAEQLRAQQDREVETFEEADDFELDGEEWFSPYEEQYGSDLDKPAPGAPVVDDTPPPAEPAPVTES